MKRSIEVMMWITMIAKYEIAFMVNISAVFQGIINGLGSKKGIPEMFKNRKGKNKI